MTEYSFTATTKSKLTTALLDYYGSSINFSQIQKLLKAKDIKINGKRISKDVLLLEGDCVTLYSPSLLCHNKKTVNVIFSDSNIAVLHKPKGITSQQFFELASSQIENLRFVHRLDTNTCGIMLFALNDTAEQQILQAFRLHQFDKFYMARVYGVMPNQSQLLTAYLVKNAVSGTVKVYKNNVPSSKIIKTKYQVISANQNDSLLLIELLTGRTHQIRAHLAFIGHPIIGDSKYGEIAINRMYKKKVQQLTACKLVLHFEKNSQLSYLNGKVFEINVDI